MEKQGREESEWRREEERRSEKGKSEKKEDARARKGRKVAIHWCFPMICGSGGSKSRLAKAAGAEPSGQRVIKNGKTQEPSYRSIRHIDLSSLITKAEGPKRSVLLERHANER